MNLVKNDNAANKRELIKNKIIRHISNFFDHDQIVKAAKISLISKKDEEEIVESKQLSNARLK